MLGLTLSLIRMVATRLGPGVVASLFALISQNWRPTVDPLTESHVWPVSEAIDSLLSTGARPAYNTLRQCAAASRDHLEQNLKTLGNGKLIASLERNAQAYRNLSGRKGRVLRRIGHYRILLERNLNEKEAEARDLLLQIEKNRIVGDTKQENRQLKDKLTRCYQWQALHTRLVTLTQQYEQQIEKFFTLAADAGKNLNNHAERLRLERDMSSDRDVPLRDPEITGRAWDVLSSLRETQRAIEQLVGEMETCNSGEPHMYKPAQPVWPDVAALIVQLETTQHQSTFALR